MASEREKRNRDQLVRKARFLLFSEGFSGLSMETAAERLGVSKATLYKYFPGKRALVSAVVDLQMEDLASRMGGVADGNAPFPEGFAFFLGMIFEVVSPAMRRFVPDLIRDAPWEWERIAAFRRVKLFGFLACLLRQGEEQGYLRGDLNKEALAPMIFAIIEQFGKPEVLVELPMTVEEALRSFAGILSQGILSESGRRELERIGSDIDKTPSRAAGVEGKGQR